MEVLIGVVLSLAVGEDTYTVTLTFQTMHCESCREELTTALGRVPGKKSVALGDKSAVVQVEERSKFDLGRYRTASPRDMKLVSVRIRVRGKVSDTGGRVKVTTRGAAQVFDLRNPEKQDVLGEIRKQLGGDNKFFVEGVALAASALELLRFEKTTYEDR